MTNFKDIMAADMDVFFNTDEYAEPHNIDGRILNVIVDNDRLMQRSKKEFDGISVGEILYFVSETDYGPPPKVDDIQIFDNKAFQVFDARPDAGMYEIILRRNGV